VKVEFVPPAAGRVFISYRREETAWQAGWLFDRLVDRFGRGQIFKDIDSIELGDDFVEVITAAVGSCDVLLALIGDRWLTIADGQGPARLEDPEDFVRLELEAALTRNVRVIPILVAGARMPRPDQLPPSLAKLARRQALELSPSRFESDTGRLLKVLERTLADVNARPAAAEPEVAVATGQASARALYIEARAEMRLGQFQTAVDLLTDLLAVDPNHRDAAQLRDAATHQLRLAETYQRAADAEAASEWVEAVTAYSAILEVDPTYRDAAGRLKACEARQQVSDLQGELRHHAAASHWQAVLDVNAELFHLDPSAADPDGLATQAQQALDQEQAQRGAQESARRPAEEQAQREAEEAARRQDEEAARRQGQIPREGNRNRRKGQRWVTGVLIAAAVVAVAMVVSVVIVGLHRRAGVRSLTYAALRSGDCLTGSNLGLGTTGYWPTRVQAVPCTQKHIAEVYYASNWWTAKQDNPGDKALIEQGLSQCLTAFFSYVGVLFSESEFNLRYVLPDGETWGSGDRRLVCIAYKPGAATLNATIKGSYCRTSAFTHRLVERRNPYPEVSLGERPNRYPEVSIGERPNPYPEACEP
jgi:tetratricopeptide (TPR) repeat protein